jgi:phospholipid N-methyltransferase
MSQAETSTPPSPPGSPAAPGTTNANEAAKAAEATKADEAATTPDWWLMTKKFLRKGKEVASVCPSSPYLIRALLKGLDFRTAQVIVELGGGTGPITAELARRVRPGCKLIVLELDPDFCQRLRQRFPHLDIVQGDALDLPQILDARGIDLVDHIISGLPMPSIPEPNRSRIIQHINDRLKPEGSFRQLTVIPFVYWPFYQRRFDNVKYYNVILNVPPGGAYICKPRKRNSPPPSVTHS